MTATTIKVPSDLRDRLNAEARDAGMTVAGVIEQLIATRDRAELFRRMREDRARLSAEERSDLEAEYRLWSDAAAGDARGDVRGA